MKRATKLKPGMTNIWNKSAVREAHRLFAIAMVMAKNRIKTIVIMPLEIKYIHMYIVQMKDENRKAWNFVLVISNELSLIRPFPFSVLPFYFFYFQHETMLVVTFRVHQVSAAPAQLSFYYYYFFSFFGLTSCL